MNLKRCGKGHFYNADKFPECPRCASLKTRMNDPVTAAMVSQPEDSVTMPMSSQTGVPANMAQGRMEPPVMQMEDSVTVAMPQVQMEDSVTVPLSYMQTDSGTAQIKQSSSAMAQQPSAEAQMGQPSQAAVQQGQGTPLQNAINKAIAGDDDGKTVSLYQTKKGIDPVAGWLVCIEGEDFGGSFTIKSGRNFVGRSREMDIVLHGDNSISREKHAVILYEPKRREFIAQAGESRELFYLNDEVVLNPVRLKQYDILTVGNTRLMFFPCCGENFGWDDIILNDR